MKKLKSRGKICWPLFMLLVAVCLSLPTNTFGQSSNRWLLIFETTSSMRDRTNGLLNEVQDLVSTGMHGTIYTGDTIGIWAFSDKIQNAPLQTWSPKESRTILRHTLNFVSAQPYAGSPRMNEMLTNMLNVVDASPFITVILFTDADDPVKGTPFDAPINQFFKNSYRHQKKAAMPVITVLRGVKGELTTNTLNNGPWPVDIPSVPPPPPSPPKPPAAAPPAGPPPIPPIIYHGKPESSAPTPAAPAAPATPSDTVESNTVAPKAEAPAPPIASGQPVSPAAAEPGASGTAGSAEAPKTTAANEPAPDATPAAAPAAVSTTESGMSQPAASNTPSASRPTDAVAASAPQQNLLSARNIAIFSVAFTVIVCGSLIMSARRARASQSSLITRSLDRENR